MITARIIQIGTSRGIIIPANLLKELNLSEDVYLIPSDDSLVIKPKPNPLNEWKKEMDRLATQGETFIPTNEDNLFFNTGNTDGMDDDWDWDWLEKEAEKGDIKVS